MDKQIAPGWQTVLTDEFEKPYFEALWNTVSQAYSDTAVYPAAADIFSAFNLCSLSKTKVVILGQDPYHTAGVAHGLAFSVAGDTPIPPSLRNIYKELISDVAKTPPLTGDLTNWARQGVLLLNSTLTVEKDTAGSHQTIGWEKFTDHVITTISDSKTAVVFLLWGTWAQQKRQLIDTTKHLVLTAPHPSPLSAYRGFFGCRHFSQTNQYLETHNQNPIRW